MQFEFRDYKSILPFLRNRRRRFLKLVPEVVTDLGRASRVLDIGCGDGRISAAIAGKARCHTLAIDSSPDAAEATRQWVAEKRLERYVETAHLAWERLDGQPYDRILAIHLLYHIDRSHWQKFADWALDHLSPGGWLVVVTTSKTAHLHNYFADVGVIENMVHRVQSLEGPYGSYVFGEEFHPLTNNAWKSYRTRFTVQWPFGRANLRHRDTAKVEQAWLKLFSFIYRLPVQTLREEFGGELRRRLEHANLDLRIEGRDVVHVLNKP